MGKEVKIKSFDVLARHLLQQSNAEKERAIRQREIDEAESDRFQLAKPYVTDPKVLQRMIDEYLAEHKMPGQVGAGKYTEVPHDKKRKTHEGKQLFAMEPIIRHELDCLLASSTRVGRISALDSACGMATSWRTLAAIYPDVEFIGVDIRPPQECHGEAPKNFSYLRANLRDLSRIRNFGRVDLFFEQYGVISVSADPANTLIDHANLVKPGGVMILSGAWPSTVITQDPRFPAREHPDLWQKRRRSFVEGLQSLAASGYEICMPTDEKGTRRCVIEGESLDEWIEDPMKLQRITDVFHITKPKYPTFGNIR